MIELKNISKKYEEKIELFRDFDISFEANKITALTGRSGTGKTTLLRIIAGLDSYDSGSISGVENKKISFIFQEKRILPWLNVYKNIEFVLKNTYKSKTQQKSIIEKVLSQVNLLDKQYHMPSQLSGGMLQRLSIARCFAYPSDIILMDEPFRELDISVIFVYHDVEKLVKIAHKIYAIDCCPVKIIHENEINMELSERNLSHKTLADIAVMLKELM